jgi:hypothetical protein
LIPRQKVDAVVCLGDIFIPRPKYVGDVLDTREVVSVRAQSASFSFFNEMNRTLSVPIHIILGNHDMNLKHSHDISRYKFYLLRVTNSLDSLDMDGFRKQNIYLYRL